jgi:hypothetical protein
MEVDQSTDWWRDMEKTLYLAYHRAPFWGENKHFPKIVATYGGLALTLGDGIISDLSLYDKICRKVRMVWLQSELGIVGEKQELVVNLCKYFKADAFLFGRNGRDYVDEEYFKAQGIEPLYQDYQYPVYKQWGDVFISGLSVIDMLFNVGIDGTRKLICGK